jgi:putative chitinase
VETPKYAVMVSGWYWHTRKLNGLADIRDFRKITKLINGGYNGYADRVNHYNKALKAFGLDPFV